MIHKLGMTTHMAKKPTSIRAKIYKPAKTAMQSGDGNTKLWVLEFDPVEPAQANPLIGWQSSGDMRQQLKLKFDTKEQAIAYAKQHHIEYRVLPTHTRKITPKSYADNFKANF